MSAPEWGRRGTFLSPITPAACDRGAVLMPVRPPPAFREGTALSAAAVAEPPSCWSSRDAAADAAVLSLLRNTLWFTAAAAELAWARVCAWRGARTRRGGVSEDFPAACKQRIGEHACT